MRRNATRAPESASTAARVVCSGPAGPRPTTTTTGRPSSALIEAAGNPRAGAGRLARYPAAVDPVLAPALGTNLGRRPGVGIDPGQSSLGAPGAVLRIDLDLGRPQEMREDLVQGTQLLRDEALYHLLVSLLLALAHQQQQPVRAEADRARDGPDLQAREHLVERGVEVRGQGRTR